MQHIPSFIKNEDVLKRGGIDEVFIMGVHDSAVMNGFGKALGIKEDSIIKCVGDPTLAATKRLSTVLDAPMVRTLFGGARTKRFSALVEDGTVKYLAIAGEGGATDEDTFAGKILELV